MKKYLLVGIVILIVILVLLALYFKPFAGEQKISALVYESTYGYRIEMERQQDGILFTYDPMDGKGTVSQVRGEECYDIAMALLKETGLSEATASSKNIADKDADKLTIKYEGGEKRVLARSESDDAFRSVRSCLMEFSGFHRDAQPLILEKEPE